MKVPKYKDDATRTEPRMTTNFLDQERVKYEEKKDNPTEAPQ